MSRQNSSPLGVGVISILTVLLVLCLTIFSALTLSTARADLNLSRINAATVSAYYAADAQATARYAAFSAGTAEELVARFPISDQSALLLHLARRADGTVRILAWQTVTETETADGSSLPVWAGQPAEERITP